MSFNKLFLYDAAIAEQGGTTTEETPSIASLLATQGKITETSNDTPPEAVINKETPEEPKQPEVQNAASANEPSSAVQGNSESQAPKAEEPKVETPTIPEQQAVQPSWQEVLKAQQPETVFKELGYDEKVVNISKTLSESPQMAALFEAWISKGDITPYLKAVATDYNNMDSEQLMRHQLLEDYPDADEATINALYQRKVVKAYGLDSSDEDELAEGKLLLDADAKKVKEGLIDKQKQFLTPAPPEPKAPEPQVDTEAEERRKRNDIIVNSIKDSSYTKDLLSNGKIIIGEGEDAFPYVIPKPQEVLDLIFDGNKYQSKMYIKQQDSDVMTPNVQKQLVLAAIADDMDGFFKKFGDHFKSLGSATITAQIENASIPSTATSSSASAGKSIAAQMATAGRISN